MYSDIRFQRRVGTERRIRITEVNTSQRYVVGTDSYGAPLRANWYQYTGLVSVPAVGELWTVSRYQNEWELVRKAETGSENTPIGALLPGDKRLEAVNNLYLNGENVLINNRDFDDTVQQLADEILQATPPGIIWAYTAHIAPPGWLICDGKPYNGTLPLYEPLWNLIGNTYGGTNQLNFQVPDLQGRMVVGLAPTGHIDVNQLGKNEGLALGNRKPKHTHDHTFTGSTNLQSGTDYKHEFTLSEDGPTDSETGPSYITLQYIIKL